MKYLTILALCLLVSGCGKDEDTTKPSVSSGPPETVTTRAMKEAKKPRAKEKIKYKDGYVSAIKRLDRELGVKDNMTDEEIMKSMGL